MATKTTETKNPKVPVALTDRVKTQLSTAVLKNKIKVEELAALEAHIAKLKALLA